MGSLDDGQAYKSEADCDQKPSSRVSAVLTCSGNLTDPDFNEKRNALFDRLQNVLCNGKIVLGFIKKEIAKIMVIMFVHYCPHPNLAVKFHIVMKIKNLKNKH